MKAKFSPTLRQLRALMAVYELRKLNAAAEQLSVTPSAVSVLLRQLEEGLGVRLFDRTTRSLQPTQAAEDAVLVAARILRDVELLGAEVSELTGLHRGRVSIAVTPTLAGILLPGTVRRYTARHPGVRIVIDDCAPDQFMARVAGEQVDFGIGTPEGSAAGVDLHTLMRDHLSVVMPHDHPLARRKSVRWADLAGCPVITVRPGYGIRPLIDATAARAGVVLQVVNEVTFLSTALWMTRAGLGLSIMPWAYATSTPDAALAVRTLGAPRVSRDLVLVTRRGRSLPPACAAFVQMLRADLATARRLEPET